MEVSKAQRPERSGKGRHFPNLRRERTSGMSNLDSKANRARSYVTSKICKQCGGVEFYADGRCKACRKAQSAARYKANPEKAKARAAAWAAANYERVLARMAAYYAANPGKVAAKCAAWYAANAEAAKQKSRDRAKANPGAVRAAWQNRRARKIAAGGSLSPGLAKRLLKLQKGKCACCGEPLGADYHMDHIMPLVLGGSNTDDNMQLLRSRCNQQKCAKHPVDFMRARGFLL